MVFCRCNSGRFNKGDVSMSGIYAPSAPIKFDANGNVLSNINAQNIDPTIANSYSPILLSHQTGLSASISAGGTYVNVGSSFTIPRNGIIAIYIFGHGSSASYQSLYQVSLTRSSSTYPNYLGSIESTSPTSLGSAYLISVLANDSIQPQVSYGVSNYTVYLDDLVVILI
ncbi:MAG: hypothetical protein QXP04_05320 [Candidatus Nanoarchaeia archaeon]|nr:hypothetical protein [Candidatus Jingweiarchaeum tengchongense]